MSLATLEQIQQLIEGSLGVHAKVLEIENYFLPLRTIHEWEILYHFIETDYESVFDVDRFSNLIEQQCETYGHRGNLLKGKFLDVSYYLEYSTGEEKGFMFSMYNDKPAFLRGVTCCVRSINLETELGEERIFWRGNKSFNLDKYNIDIKVQERFRTVSLQEFPAENAEGYISCVIPIDLDGSIHTREEAVKFASESLVYAFATQVFRVF